MNNLLEILLKQNDAEAQKVKMPKSAIASRKRKILESKPVGGIHKVTVDLINSILHKENCPDNVKTDTLRLLTLMLEEDPQDNYGKKEFMAYLSRKNSSKKKIKMSTAKVKATGQWVIQ